MRMNTPDYFPDEGSQWMDSDGDGYGDNPDEMTPMHFRKF